MRHIHRFFFLLFIGGGILACSNTYVDDIDRGSSFNFRPGFPELRVNSTGYLDRQNNALINVTGEVVYGSLVFTQSNSMYKSYFNVEISVTDQESEALIKRVEFADSLSFEDERLTYSQDVYSFSTDIEVRPGNFNVEVRVTDENSSKVTSRITTTEIPNPQDNISHLTEIRILGKQDITEDEYYPITTYDIPGKIDSLKFIFQVTNNDPENPVTILSELLKFKADTSVARSINYNNYSQSSIQYRGIEYDEFEIIQSSRRVLNQSGSVQVELIFTDLETGNYRVRVTTESGEDEGLFKARDFSIKSENYPSVATPRELAAPLTYLMGDREYERLMNIKSDDSLKKAIDRFWLSNIGNASKAKSVINLYYQRVEEANKQFSNFKEGWKTDTGMIYILFGPPWYDEYFVDQMTWLYTYNRYRRERVFNFYQARLKTRTYPFYNYLLDRKDYYYNEQLQQIDRWLTGAILVENL